MSSGKCYKKLGTGVKSSSILIVIQINLSLCLCLSVSVSLSLPLSLSLSLCLSRSLSLSLTHTHTHTHTFFVSFRTDWTNLRAKSLMLHQLRKSKLRYDGRNNTWQAALRHYLRYSLREKLRRKRKYKCIKVLNIKWKTTKTAEDN